MGLSKSVYNLVLVQAKRRRRTYNRCRWRWGWPFFFFNPNVTSFSAAARKQPRSDGRSRSSADNSVQSHPRSPGFLSVSWLDTNVTRRTFSASNDPYECCRFRSQTLSNQDDKMVIQIYKDKKCKFDKTTIFRKRVNFVFLHSKP